MWGVPASQLGAAPGTNRMRLSHSWALRPEVWEEWGGWHSHHRPRQTTFHPLEESLGQGRETELRRAHQGPRFQVLTLH